VPTARQRRDAARRHVERQLRRRAGRQAAHQRFALVASIVGTLIVAAIVLGYLIAVGHDDRHGGRSAGVTGTSATVKLR
jgi:ABC-type transport system involved in cytochrome bd biosynthesis fused ATPase/permease subunit